MARGATRAHARPRLDSSARNRASKTAPHSPERNEPEENYVLPESSVPACCYFSLSVSPRAQSDRRPAPTDTLARPSRRDHAYALTRLTHALSRFTRAAPAVPRCLGKINTTSGLREGFSNSNPADMSSVAAPRNRSRNSPSASSSKIWYVSQRSPRAAPGPARAPRDRTRAHPRPDLFFACQHRTGKQSARGRRISNRTRRKPARRDG